MEEYIVATRMDQDSAWMDQTQIIADYCLPIVHF